jgi:hypothetical protein
VRAETRIAATFGMMVAITARSKAADHGGPEKFARRLRRSRKQNLSPHLYRIQHLDCGAQTVVNK